MAEKKSRIEERMKKMNATLSDDEMAMATGGANGDVPEPKFHAGDRVRCTDDEYIDEAYIIEPVRFQNLDIGWIYLVRAHDEEGWFELKQPERFLALM